MIGEHGPGGLQQGRCFGAAALRLLQGDAQGRLGLLAHGHLLGEFLLLQKKIADQAGKVAELGRRGNKPADKRWVAKMQACRYAPQGQVDPEDQQHRQQQYDSRNKCNKQYKLIARRALHFAGYGRLAAHADLRNGPLVPAVNDPVKADNAALFLIGRLPALVPPDRAEHQACFP